MRDVETSPEKDSPLNNLLSVVSKPFLVQNLFQDEENNVLQQEGRHSRNILNVTKLAIKSETCSESQSKISKLREVKSSALKKARKETDEESKHEELGEEELGEEEIEEEELEV